MKTPFVVPVPLANKMADAVSADALERGQLVDAATRMGDWLAERQQPGRWDLLDLEGVMAGITPRPAETRRRMLLQMVGLVGFAAFDGEMEPHAAAEILEKAQSLTRNEAIQGLAASTAHQLRRLTPM